MPPISTIFQDKDTVYFPGTCEPLKQAKDRKEVHMQAWSQESYPGVSLPPNFLPELRTIGVWDASHKQSWGLDLHCNEGIEFTFLAKGKTAFQVDGEKCMLTNGNFTITRPWQFHQVGDPHISASRLYWLIIDVGVRRPNQVWKWPDWLILSKEELARLTELIQHNEQPVWQANPEVSANFSKLIDLVENEEPSKSETKMKLYTNEFLLAVLNMLEQKRIPLNQYLSSSCRVVEMFLNRLRENPAHDWELISMAKQCGLSRSQFSTYCAEITNMTPIKYLTQCRINLSAQLLVEHPEMSIKEIAHSCGFNASRYFSTTFQAHQGCSPSEYRNPS